MCESVCKILLIQLSPVSLFGIYTIVSLNPYEIKAPRLELNQGEFPKQV